MKYIEDGDDDQVEGMPVVELTERNLWTLIAKLRDPLSNRMLADPDHRVIVRAVPDDEHYKTRPPGLVYMPSEGRYL